jgi:hypothetical protein
MNREDCERAINELDELLATTNDERFYQAWFEKHSSVVLLILCLKRLLPHPVLENPDYIPDFLAEENTDLWKIVELKRPDAKILNDKKRRSTFYSALQKYISQCQDYSDFFGQDVKRKQFNEKNSTNIQSRVNSILIIGRDKGLDKLKAYKMLDGTRIDRLLTYDDVINMLHSYRQQLFGSRENKPGISLHVVLIPYRLKGQINFIWDFGIEKDNNRVSIFIKDDFLYFKIIDSNGESYINKLALSNAGLKYNNLAYVSFELALDGETAYSSIEINGNKIKDCTYPAICLDLNILQHYVMASNVTGAAQTAIDFVEVINCGNSLSFDERIKIREYVFNRYMPRLGITLPLPRMTARNQQFMYSQNHPNFVKESALSP